MARDGGGGRGGEDDEDGSRACVRAARARAAATSCAHCRAARAVTYRYADGIKACAACDGDGARANGAHVSRRAHRLCEECVGGDPALAEWFCAQDEVREGWTSATRWVDNEVMDKARAR